MESVRLILVRHGETDWNKEARYQGQTDIPLNSEGVRQAEALARRITGERINAIYSSDLVRASSTARIIGASCNLEVNLSPGLREMDFGEWEGLTFKEIEERYGELWRRWLKSPLCVAPPGGETLGELRDRVIREVDELIARWRNGECRTPTGAPSGTRTQSGQDGPTILVVAHGGPIRIIISRALGLPPDISWSFKLDHGGLSIVDFLKEGALVCTLNDTCHL